MSPSLPARRAAVSCRQAVHPARPPGCQGNVTNAARALNPCQDPARAGRRRQNFQTICWAIPGVSLSIVWPLPPGLLLSMNFHGKKVGRLCYMFSRPAALRVVAVGRLRPAWLAPGLQGDPVRLPCALLRFVGQCSSCQVTRHVSRGQTPPGREHPCFMSRRTAFPWALDNVV